MSDLKRTRAAAWAEAEAAEAYERLRPGYPVDAVDWLVPQDARRVLDLGAGTGKLTRALLGRDVEVVAVDPSAAMLRVLARSVPGVPTYVGTGEGIPLPSGSVDAVVCAQAWHWVDPGQACAEVARVLRPGGRLGLVWNADDLSVPWLAGLQALKRGARGDSTGQGAEGEVVIGELGITAAFTTPEETSFRWHTEITTVDMVDLVATRSYILTAPPDQRGRLLDEVRQLLACDPGTAGREVLRLPMVTECVRATLRS